MNPPSLRTAFQFVCIGIAVLQACVAFSQSTFALQNKNAFSGIDAPVFDSLGMPLVGANYRAELWGGMSADTLIPAADIEYQQPRLIIPFGNSGYFNTSRIATILSIVPPGGLLGCRSALGTRDWENCMRMWPHLVWVATENRHCFFLLLVVIQQLQHSPYR